MRIIIADADEEFIARYTKYVRHYERDHLLIAKSYSHFDTFKACIDADERHALLLISEHWLEKLYKEEVSYADYKIVVLSNDEHLNMKTSLPHIFKYQPLSELSAKLLHMFRHTFEHTAVESSGRQLDIISFFSTTGGSGKTTAAINMLKQLSKRQKRVFYLNLEALSSASLFMPQSEHDDLAYLLYYLKNKSMAQAQEKLMALIKFNALFQCDYIEPLKQYKDCEDIEAEDVCLILELLSEAGRYDAIVIDLDASLHPKNIGAISKSDHIIWLLTDDVHCKLKTKAMVSELLKISKLDREQLLNKVTFTLNKHTGHTLNDYAKDDIDIAYYLPYIPQWKAVDDATQFYEPTVFQQQMSQIYNALRAG